MKLSELLVGIKAKNDFMDVEIDHITEDSRRISQGSAFVCIKGETVDGHDFALSASEKGASVIVAEENIPNIKNLVVVEDTRVAFALMCANYYGNPSKSLKMVGITGTNGKTSVSYYIKSILETSGFKTGIIGTVQNMIGDEIVPASFTTPDPWVLHGLLRKMADAKCEYCVMEASSQALAQGRVIGCEFDVSVFTNLTQDHLDYHKSMDNYLAAKRILFKQSQIAVINIDDPNAREVVNGADCEIVTYSTKTDSADYTGRNIRLRMSGVEFEFLGVGKIARMKLATPGMFSVYNALAASVCAIKLGVDFSDAVSAMSLVRGVAGRMEVYPTNDDYIIIIDYAHTPDGLKNVLSSLKEIAEGRIVTVVGCGGDRDRTKRPIMGRIASEYSDYLVVTSDNPRSEDPAKIIEDILEGVTLKKNQYKVIEDRKEAIKFAIENKRKHDIILLAGKGHENYQILKTGKIHFDEREIISEIIGNKQNK